MSNIAYLRVSHTESLNGTSLEVQEKRCRAFAELHGFTIDKVYSVFLVVLNSEKDQYFKRFYLN